MHLYEISTGKKFFNGNFKMQLSRYNVHAPSIDYKKIPCPHALIYNVIYRMYYYTIHHSQIN